jgi:hypothetical protein
MWLQRYQMALSLTNAAKNEIALEQMTAAVTELKQQIDAIG